MPELLEVDLFGGKTVFAFDGRVLEVFSNIYGASARLDAVRIYVEQLTVTVSEPGKDQLREVGFTGPVGYQYKVRGLDETMWGTLQPLLAALESAGATLEWPSA